MQEIVDPWNYKEGTPQKDAKIIDYKKVQIALSGSMIAFGASVIGYTMFGFIGGFSFIVMVFGIMWFAQIQLETALDTIEIQVKQE